MKHPVRILAGLLLAGAALTQSSCNEDAIIKSNLSNSGIFDSTVSNFTIFSKTVLDDSVIVNGHSSTSLIVLGLGTVNDPQFGLTNSGIYFQVVPTKGNFNFSDNLESIDSAFVVLRSVTHWGDTLGPAQSYTVYKLTDDLKRDDVNFSFTFKNFDPTPVSPETVRDMASVTKDSVLRIPLTSAFISELQSAALNSGDNSSFLSKIKGLFVKTSNVGRTLNFFAMNGTSDLRRAAIQFFYREKGSSDVKTAFFNFDPNVCGYSNYITHGYNGTFAQQQFNSTNSTDNVMLLQNEPGAAMDIRITGLNQIPVAIINRATLAITQVNIGEDDIFTSPPFITPFGVDSNGKQYLLADQQANNEGGTAAAFVDGAKKSVNLGGGITVNRYTINIPREIQTIVARRGDELHLHINGTRDLFGAYRMGAGGSSYADPQYRVRMDVTYSKLN